MRRWPNIGALRAVAVCAAVCCAASALAGEGGDSASKESEGGERCAVVERADRLLAQAGGAWDAAAAWLESNASPAAVEALAEEGKRRIDERIEAYLAAAREMAERERGLFLYEEKEGGGASWSRMEAPVPEGCARAVLLVHGLDEPGGIWAELAPRLREEGHCVVRFAYANDQPIGESASDLGEAMKRLRAAGVEEVSLVCHSMGGLLARDVLTREGYYAGDDEGEGLPRVGRLITVGTPNHGSVLAPLRALGEVREQFARWMTSDGWDPRALMGFASDGEGEAGEDLLPGSEYLEGLNARGLPEEVELTVVIGRIAPGDAPAVDSLLESAFVRRVLGEERVDRLREQARRAAGAVGDGVVPVESARLEGVEDTVIVEADHRSMLRTIALERGVRRMLGDERDEPPAIPIILDRLGAGAENVGGGGESG